MWDGLGRLNPILRGSEAPGWIGAAEAHRKENPTPRVNPAKRIVFALPTQDASNGVLFFGLVLGVVLSSLLDGPQTGPKKFRAFWAPNLGRFWNHVGAISDDFCVFFRHLNLRPL